MSSHYSMSVGCYYVAACYVVAAAVRGAGQGWGGGADTKYSGGGATGYTVYTLAPHSQGTSHQFGTFIIFFTQLQHCSHHAPANTLHFATYILVEFGLLMDTSWQKYFHLLNSRAVKYGFAVD